MAQSGDTRALTYLALHQVRSISEETMVLNRPIQVALIAVSSSIRGTIINHSEPLRRFAQLHQLRSKSRILSGWLQGLTCPSPLVGFASQFLCLIIFKGSFTSLKELLAIPLAPFLREDMKGGMAISYGIAGSMVRHVGGDSLLYLYL